MLELPVIVPATVVVELWLPPEGTLWVIVKVKWSAKVPVPPVTVKVPKLLTVGAVNIGCVASKYDLRAAIADRVICVNSCGEHAPASASEAKRARSGVINICCKRRSAANQKR